MPLREQSACTGTETVRPQTLQQRAPFCTLGTHSTRPGGTGQRWLRSSLHGRVLRRSTLLDIDHVVTLAHASRGARSWSRRCRERFANDLRDQPQHRPLAPLPPAVQPGSGAGDGIRRAPSQRQGEALLAARRDGAVARAVTTASSPCLVTPVAW